MYLLITITINNYRYHLAAPFPQRLHVFGGEHREHESPRGRQQQRLFELWIAPGKGRGEEVPGNNAQQETGEEFYSNGK